MQGSRKEEVESPIRKVPCKCSFDNEVSCLITGKRMASFSLSKLQSAITILKRGGRGRREEEERERKGRESHWNIKEPREMGWRVSWGMGSGGVGSGGVRVESGGKALRRQFHILDMLR